LVVLLLTFIELRGDSSRVANNKLKIGDVSVIHHPSHHLQSIISSIIHHPSSCTKITSQNVKPICHNKTHHEAIGRKGKGERGFVLTQGQNLFSKTTTNTRNNLHITNLSLIQTQSAHHNDVWRSCFYKESFWCTSQWCLKVLFLQTYK